MERRILLIDNEDVAPLFDTTGEKIEDSGLGFEFEGNHFNPVDRRFEDDERNIDHDKAREALVKEHLQEKLDVVGCDFNLHETEKTLTYNIIETIRQYNRTCSLFIYSGGMNRSTLELFNSLGKKPAEGLLNISLRSNICRYIVNRGAVADGIIEMLKQPSIDLQIENFLLENGTLKIIHGYSTFNGKQLFEIAKEIRTQTELGKRYSQEIISRGLAHMIDLNNFE